MKKCILIYDDDPEISMVCKIILERKGYTVETRLFCDNILQDISDVKPDVIFMDLWIPAIGGEKAISILKTNSSTMQIPVVLFSANTDIEMIAERVNADGYLAKPFDIALLIETVEDVFVAKKD